MAVARLITRVLPGFLVLAGFIEALVVYVANPGPHAQFVQIAYGLVTALLVFYLGRATPTPANASRWVPAILVGTTLLSFFLAQWVLEAYPISADEYGYNYLADTLRHGRLWNQAYPAPIRDVLETFYIGGHGDQRLSQYSPGWPSFLLPFQLAGIPQWANAVYGLIAALFLFAALRQLPAPPAVRAACLALGIAVPFTIVNDASFFSHTITATALLGIIWLDLRDPANPSPWNRVGIGIFFSILLAARYEAFLLAFLLFTIDGLYRRRLSFIRWSAPAAIGAAPITLLLLAYNWQITGSPFTTTNAWVNPGLGFGLHAVGGDGQHSPRRALLHTLQWFSSWQDFAATILLPLYLLALWRRVRLKTVRWFDLLWPAVVVFFAFFPDDGGFQYGPRYWYIGHAPMPVTLAAGLPLAGPFWRVGRWRFDPIRLAAAQMASLAGFIIGYAAFLHVQTENRLTPPRLAATATAPAIVLMQSYGRRYLPFQGYSFPMLAPDYTRNGVGPLGPIVAGIDLGDARTALLCTQMPDRAVYRIQLDRIGPGGSLVPVCNGAVPPSP